MTDTPKRKRGRPRKDPLASVTSAQLVFTHPYTTNGSYWRTAPVIAKELREFAAKYAQQPMAKNLADWIEGIAKCVEAGNAVEAGFCGLSAASFRWPSRANGSMCSPTRSANSLRAVKPQKPASTA